MSKVNIQNAIVGTITLGYVLLWYAVPHFAHAGPIIRSGEKVNVDAEQVLEGDFYGLGNTLTISGKANEDVYVAGGTVTINGDIDGDLTVIGGVVQVHGAVGDDIRIVGGEVTIAEPVGGDVVAVGATISVLSTATVGGDVIVAGSEATIDGPVLGSIFGAANQVRINTRVGGQVKLNVGTSITLGDKADIAGDVYYRSPTDLIRAQNAVVSGKVVRENATVKSEASFSLQSLAFAFLTLLFVALSFYLVARSRLDVFAQKFVSEYGKFSLVGLGMLIGTPLVVILLMVSIIGMFAGILLLLLYILLLFLSWVTLPAILGTLIMRALKKEPKLTIVNISLGAALMVSLPLIPVIGGLILAVLIIVTLGGYGMMLYRFLR